MNKITVIISTILLFCVCKVASENKGWQEYLQDNSEEFHDIPLTWESGSNVPSWLSGTYVRNGPGQHEFGSDKRKLSNWLDGFAKLHSFKFNGDRVLFSGKMLESQNYLDSVAAGELVPQFTLNQFVNPEDDWNIFEKMKIFYKMLDGTAFDNFNPMVWRFGEANLDNGVFMAVTDAPAALRFNISDLSTMGVQMPARYPPSTTGCAHPLREPGTDNTINFMTKLSMTGTPYIEVQRYRPEDSFSEPQIITTFTPEKTSIVHSFSLTEDYAIIFMYPLDVDIMKIFTSNFHLFEAMEWDETEDTDVYIINLNDGDVLHLNADPVYSLHHANAYQVDEEEIVVDLCEHGHTGLSEYLRVDNLLQPPATTEWKFIEENEFARWRINLNTGKVTKQSFRNETDSIFANMIDFPMINENYRGKEYCYVYGVSLVDYTRTAIVKKNVCRSGEDKIWYKENHYLSEIWFHQSPNSTVEDDGVLMTLAFDGERKQSYMMIIDALTLETIATSYLPHNIPWSAHGYHFYEAQF